MMLSETTQCLKRPITGNLICNEDDSCPYWEECDFLKKALNELKE